MLTRTWTGRVSETPGFRLRVTGADPAPAADGRWQDADEPTLVAACLAGDATAFDVIVERVRNAKLAETSWKTTFSYFGWVSAFMGFVRKNGREKSDMVSCSAVPTQVECR